MKLHTSDTDLRDLAKSSPELVDASSGRATGLRLLSCLGGGGMSTVFVAELDPQTRSLDLAETTPRRVAVKFLQISTYEHFKRQNLDPSNVFLREVVALSRMMERQPPSEFVVGFYGSGHADVVHRGQVRRLPWLALELVDGGIDGVSLTERVERSPEGIDPIRAIRLLRGIFSGVKALHGEGIIHRDVKPDNVLVVGPVDDETPKLADCGIARVDGLMATIAGMTPSYGGPEQVLSITGIRNPLIGPWTDVHGLAAVAWFLLGGGDWCRGDADGDWHRGMRRSLRTGGRVHRAFMSDGKLLAQLDSVLARGAAPRLPEIAWEEPGAPEQARLIPSVAPAMAVGIERYESVDAFEGALLPLLERFQAAWTARAGVENRAATAFRPTQLLRKGTHDGPRALVEDVPDRAVATPASAGGVVFQPDGRVLARFGSELAYFIDDAPHRVSVPAEHRATVAESRWLTRGPGGGFALVGPRHILLLRGGRFSSMPLPARDQGGEVGHVQAVVDDGRVFAVVTAETDESNGGPELWRSNEGRTWEPPSMLPLGGDVHSVTFGPYGFFVVGSRRGTRARALFLGFDNQPVLFVVGVNDRPALVASVSSAGREAWAAGAGFVLAFERSSVHPEAIETDEPPVAMALDVVGIPWLATATGVFRRHTESGVATWRTYHRRQAGEAPFVGIGFTTGGARVLDAHGAGVRITPHDAETWKARSSATVANRG